MNILMTLIQLYIHFLHILYKINFVYQFTILSIVYMEIPNIYSSDFNNFIEILLQNINFSIFNYQWERNICYQLLLLRHQFPKMNHFAAIWSIQQWISIVTFPTKPNYTKHFTTHYLQSKIFVLSLNTFQCE